MHQIKFLPFLLILFYTFLILSSFLSTSLSEKPSFSAFTTPEATDTPSDDDVCIYTCSSDQGSQPIILKYAENEVVKYKIRGITSLHLPNSVKGENVKLKYSANFDLKAENSCLFLLRVSDVEIIGPDGKNYFDESLEGYPAKFTWHNGKLKNLCVDKRESTAASNFKRSIISNIQVSSWGNPITKSISSEDTSLFETDVYGRCQVSLESSQEQDGSLIIKKSKDLNKCKHRQKIEFAFKTSSYLSENPIETNPFVQATFNSVIKVENGLIKAVDIKEHYNFQPLGNYGETLTSVAVTIKITQYAKSKDGFSLDTFQPKSTSLLYENEKLYRGEAIVLTLIKAIQDASREEDAGVIPSNGAKEFSKLVSVLQQANKAELLTTYAQVKSGAGLTYKNMAMSVFLDGLISALTAATTETAAILMMNKELPKNKISDFLASLSFVKYPTEETLVAVSPLLDGNDVSPDRYLAVGAIIQSYTSNYNGKNSPELLDLLRKLASPISGGCICKSIEEEDSIISSLKGLWNAKYATEEILSLVKECVINDNVTTRIRITALHTLMINSSDEMIKKEALNLFQNIHIDSEIRIAAFLLFINSPDAETAETIKTLLDIERSDQVGNYIISYLGNLQTSTDPQKEIFKRYYGNIKAKKKFSPIHFLQHSQNYHFSQSFPSLDMGYSVSADVVFSGRSYIPRQTTLNLNSNLFGHSINVFEFGVRLENVEYLLENHIGPRSYIRNTLAEDIADDFTEAVQNFTKEMIRKSSSLNRKKRKTIDTEKMLQKKPKRKSPFSEKYMDIDLSMKVFQSEMLWSAYHIDRNNIATGEYLDSLFEQIKKAIENAKNTNVDYKKYSRSTILSNNVIRQPTSSGFSLMLSINVNSVVNLKMNGNVDVMKIINEPKSTDVRLLIMPSASVEIEGLLKIDASAISVGLKASSSVRSATGLEIGLKFLEGKGCDFKIGIPVKEQDLLTLKTEVFSTIQEKGLLPIETEMKPSGKRYEKSHVFNQLSHLTGLSLYTELKTPAFNYKPQFGPSTFSIRVTKENENLQYYNIKFQFDNDSNRRSIELLCDTPGTTIDRKVLLYFEVNALDKRIIAKFINPKKKINVEVLGKTDDNEVSVNIKYNNDAAEYFMKLGATVIKEELRTIYKPFVQLKSPNDLREASLDKIRINHKQPTQLISVEGQVILEINANLLTYKKYKFDELTFISPFGKFAIVGLIQTDSQFPQYSTNLSVICGDGDMKDTFTLQSNLNYTKNIAEEKKIIADLTFMPTHWPMYSFRYTFNYDKSSNTFKRTQTFTHGSDLKSDNSKLILSEVLYTEVNLENNEIISQNGNLKALYPLWKFNMDTGFKKQNRNFYLGYCDLVLDDTNITLNSSIGLSNRKLGNVDIEFQTKMNEKNLALTAVRELINDEKSKININININPDKQIAALINLTHKLKPENYIFSANSVVTVMPKGTTYKQKIGLAYTPFEKRIYISLYPNNEKNLEIKVNYITNQSKVNANVALYIENIIDGEALFEMKATHMNAKLNMNILKIDSLIYGTLDLDINDGKNYIGYAELQWDASKNVSKKFKLRTNTMICDKNRNITTENSVQIMDYEFQINGIYNTNEELDHNDIIAEMHFIMANGFNTGIDFSRSRRVDYSTVNYDLNINGYYSQGKNIEPIKLSYQLNSKDLDFMNNIFDVKTQFSLNTSKLKNLKIGLAAHRLLSNSIWLTGGNLYADGTIINKNVNVSLILEYSDQIHDYGLLSKEQNLPPTVIRVLGNIGDDYIIENDGKIANAEINNVLSIKIPLQYDWFTLKWTTNSKFDIVPSKYINIKSINNVIKNKNKFINWNSKFEAYPKNGGISLAWESSDVTKRSMDLAYAYDSEQVGGLLGPYAQASINLTSNGKEANCLVKFEFNKDFSTKSITVLGYTPMIGKFDIHALNKVEDYGQKISNEISIINENNQWSVRSLLNAHPTKPEINLSYVSAEGESKIIIKFEELVQNSWSGFVDIDWIHSHQCYLKADGQLKLDSADDILIKVNLNSPTFSINNFSLIAANKAADGNKKKILINVKIADAVYAGSGTYIHHVDNQKLIFEGTGFLKIDNKNHPITFKYSRSQLNEGTDGEKGSVNKIYFNLDNKKYALDLQVKFTDKSFLFKQDLWHEERCYKLDLAYQIKIIDIFSYENNILVHIDWLTGERFIIEGKTTRNLSDFNHHLSIQYAQGKKVEYNIFSAAGKLGFIFTLPKRQIAAEVLYSYKLETMDGNVKMICTIWFDKKQDQNQKLLFSIDKEYKISEDRNNFVIRSTANLQIPTLPKSFTVKSGFLFSPYNDKIIVLKSEFDIFKKPEQAIIVTYQFFKEKKNLGYMFSDVFKVVSEEQKLDTELRKSALINLDHVEYNFAVSYVDYQNRKKEATVYLDFKFTSVTMKIQLFENITLNGKFGLSLGKNYIKIQEEYNIFGHKYSKTCSLNTDPNLTLLIEWKGDIKQKLEINTSFIFNQFLKVLMVTDSGKVASFTLLLDDDNFMKSETEIVIDNVEILLKNGKKDLLSMIDDVRSNSKAVVNDISNQLAYRGKQYREATVNMKPIIESSKTYLIAVKDEIKNDPSIVFASQNVKKLINGIIDFVAIILQQTSEFLGEWMYGYNVLLEKINDFIESLVPRINALLEMSIDDITRSLHEFMNQFGKLTINLLQYIRANQDKWKEVILSTFNSIRDSVKTIRNSIEEVKRNAKEFYERIRIYLNSLPITNYFKNRINQFKNSEIMQYMWSVIIETVDIIKESMPTTEMKILIETIMSTLDKIVNEKSYDMNEELMKIYKQIVESVRSLVRLVADNPNFIRDVTDTSYNLAQIIFTSIKNIPNIWHTTSNIMSWMKEIGIPSTEEILRTYAIRNLNLINQLSPYKPRIGVITNGQHIITMNGNYYGINSECQYLLAGDLINFNFTIIGDIRRGKLMSLAISSSAQTIELYAEGMPTLDKTATEFPIYGDGLYAIRNTNSIDVRVDNSVFLTCTILLDLCLIEISGFYYNKVYGLLGSMTTETFMDFTMPDMNIANDISSFIESYQIGNECKGSAFTSTIETGSFTECNEIFSGKSVLSHGFSFMKKKPFQDMCNQMVSTCTTDSQKLNVACKAGLAFSLASFYNGYYFTLPAQCSKCRINDKPLPYGFSDQVISSLKTADILLLLEESEYNQPLYNELVIKALPTIKSMLQKHGIRDVVFTLVIYGGKNIYPSLYTTNGDISLNENTKVNFSDLKQILPSSDLGKFIKNLKYLFGMYGAHQALKIANNYPFRVDSVQAIIQIDASTENTIFDEYNLYDTLLNTIVSWNIISNKIPMFLLTNKELITMENNSGDLFGFDLNTEYTSDGSKSIENTVLNRLHLLIYYGGYFALPLSTNGVIFNSSQFIHSSPDARNKLIDVFSNRVVDSLISYERTTECACGYKWGEYSELKCSLINLSKRF